MKAAVLHNFKSPLAFEDVDRPTPGPDEVLVEVEACGVCHSDLHVADGDWPQLAKIVKKPLILGHEIAGRVVEKGEAVHDHQIGDRVGIPWIFWSCGECEMCREGNENLCAKQQITGVTVDGGYAEFVKAPARHATRIPDALSSVEAAPLFCAGVTVYRALKKAHIQPGQRLAVFRRGRLGSSRRSDWRGPRRESDRDRCLQREAHLRKIAGRHGNPERHNSRRAQAFQKTRRRPCCVGDFRRKSRLRRRVFAVSGPRASYWSLASPPTRFAFLPFRWLPRKF